MRQSSIADRPLIEARIVFADGTQASRVWSMRDVEKSGSPTVDMAEWMVEPRKSWVHPQDPIIYSALVPEGREEDARAWLASL